MRVELAGHVLEALSVGGIETCFQIPSFDCCLDIGRCPPGAIARSRLLLTHAHMDHAAGLPYFVSMRAMNSMAPPRIYCPDGVRKDLQGILDLWAALDSEANRCELVGVGPGETFNLGGDRLASTFRSPHRVETIGYCLSRRRRKLKPAYHGLDGQEIGARAKRGESIYDESVVPEICFPGDTGIDVLVKSEAARKARLLLLECTFMGERPGRSWAHKGGHVHLEDIAERADLFENEAILLTHFSKRYKDTDIRRAVERSLPPHLLERVHLLLGDDPIRERRID